MAEVEAVMMRGAIGFEEKPDEQGKAAPARHPAAVGRVSGRERASWRNRATWRERVTLIESLLAQPGGFGSEADRVCAVLADAGRTTLGTARPHSPPWHAGRTNCGTVTQDPTAAPPPFPLQATVYRDV